MITLTMHYLHILVLFMIGLDIITSSNISFPCKQTVNATSGGTKVSGIYDLCDFVVLPNSQDGWYAAVDNRTTGNALGGDATNYTFYYNIASNIAKPTPDPECDNYNISWRQIHGLELGYCKEIESEGLHNATCRDENKVAITSMTAAYQAKKGKTNTDKCWRLHDGITPPIWTFINVNDPALGIQLTYKNGDWCDGGGKNREFNMKFKCSNDRVITPKYIETIFEPSTCSYELVMETYKGCPTECVVDNDKLCSGMLCEFA